MSIMTPSTTHIDTEENVQEMSNDMPPEDRGHTTYRTTDPFPKLGLQNGMEFSLEF